MFVRSDDDSSPGLRYAAYGVDGGGDLVEPSVELFAQGWAVV